jgi:hypothetical protein
MDIIRDRILSYILLDGIGEEVEKVKRVFFFDVQSTKFPKNR